jgi:hypothetical protein
LQGGCLPSISALSPQSSASVFDISLEMSHNQFPSPSASLCWGKSPILQSALCSLANQSCAVSAVSSLSPISMSSVFDLSQSFELGSSSPKSVSRCRGKSLILLSSVTAFENQPSSLLSISALSPLSLSSVFDQCQEKTSSESTEILQSKCFSAMLPQISSFLSPGCPYSIFDLSVETATSGSVDESDLYTTGLSKCAFTKAQDQGKASQLCMAVDSFCSSNLQPHHGFTQKSEPTRFLQSSDLALYSEGLAYPLQHKTSTQKIIPELQEPYGSKDLDCLFQVLTSPSLKGIVSIDIADASDLDALLSNKTSCFLLLQRYALEISKMKRQFDLMAPIELFHKTQTEIECLKMKLDAADKQASVSGSEAETLKREIILLKEETVNFNQQTVPIAKVEGIFKTIFDVMQSLKESTDRDSSEKIERASIVLKRKISILFCANGFKLNEMLLQASNRDFKKVKAQNIQKNKISLCQEGSYSVLHKQDKEICKLWKLHMK